MKKQIRTTLVLFLIFLAVVGSNGVYARFADSVSVKNHIALGDVNISLEEFERRDGKEYPYQNPKRILPGDSISKIPRITNEAKECWVRVRIELPQRENGLETLKEQHLRGMSKDWKKAGEYFYYTKTLKRKEQADIFTGVEIPKTWDSRYEMKEMEIGIRAEAIQAANFTPDFASQNPWGDQQVELCIHEKNGAVSCRTENLKLSVELNEDAEKLLAVPGDFFHNFGTLMPGDVCRDSVEISNTAQENAEIYFSAKTGKLKKGAKKLLEKLSLEISMDGKKLYRGALLGKELANPVLLKSFSPGEEGRLDFAVSVPAELKNEYALGNAEVIWTFSARWEEPKKAPSQAPHDNTKEAASVKTSDDSPSGVPYEILFLAALWVLVLAVLLRRRIAK